MKRTVVALVTLLAGSAAFAQPPGLGETRPLDPAPREPAPADDAKKPAASLPFPARPQSASDRELGRCEQLSDAARDDCLREERSAAAGETRRREPPSAPPPHNPR